MAIVRWEPARELATMEVDRLNRMFKDFYSETFSGAWVPPVDIYENDQYPGEPLDDLIPPRDGGEGLSQLDQYDRLLAATPFRADVVLVSIGGNDAGFSKLVTTCVGPGDCAETGQKWLDELPKVGAAVARAYAGIRERFRDVPVLTIPYPTPLNPAGCPGSLLSPKDHQFLHGFVTQLNLVLRHEAEKVRFHYMEDVRTGGMTLIVDQAGPTLVRLRVEGSALLANDADPTKAERGYDARLAGVLEYDPAKDAVTRFDMLAVGDYWGGDYEGGRFKRPGRTPLGIAFELTRGDDAVDRVPPLVHMDRKEEHDRYFAARLANMLP